MVNIKVLIKEIERLKTKVSIQVEEMEGDWLPLSDYSELQGRKEALDEVLQFYKKKGEN